MDAGFHYLDVSLSVVGSGVPEPINQSIKAFVTRTVVKHRLESEARTFARWQGILRLRLSEEVVSRWNLNVAKVWRDLTAKGRSSHTDGAETCSMFAKLGKLRVVEPESSDQWTKLTSRFVLLEERVHIGGLGDWKGVVRNDCKFIVNTKSNPVWKCSFFGYGCTLQGEKSWSCLKNRPEFETPYPYTHIPIFV